ncbi:hypothetical protein F66182_11209 [Fusarium sp. NRRL 66182]|nr:hypothetical protein F66182_11209 [Fusarium sp. NRRL 66182]
MVRPTISCHWMWLVVILCHLSLTAVGCKSKPEEPPTAEQINRGKACDDLLKTPFPCSFFLLEAKPNDWAFSQKISIAPVPIQHGVSEHCTQNCTDGLVAFESRHKKECIDGYHLGKKYPEREVLEGVQNILKLCKAAK